MHNRNLSFVRDQPSVDAEYCFGRPKVYLTPHELARLTIMRSKLGDTCTDRAAETLTVAAGVESGAAVSRRPAHLLKSTSVATGNQTTTRRRPGGREPVSDNSSVNSSIPAFRRQPRHA